jgi:pimeloyl-ACP methyl ester carboxylesterase
VIERITFDDGATTLLERWGTSGPLLVCVHGMTSSRRTWLRLADRFSDRYRVVAYDQRGHGDSAQVVGPMSLARGVRDLHEVLAALGEEPLALIGHSWGGAVVLSGGAKAARAVVAIDPMMRQAPDAWYDEFIAELDEQFRAVDDARAAAFRAEYADWHARDLEGKVHAVATMTSAPIAGLRDENPSASWNLLDLAIGYPIPLLLAMADREKSIVVAEDYDLTRNRAAGNVEVVEFEALGHNLHREDFAAFEETLAGFLEDVAAR